MSVAVTIIKTLDILLQSGVAEKFINYWIKNPELRSARETLQSPEFKMFLENLNERVPGRPKDEESHMIRTVLRPLVKAWLKARLKNKKKYLNRFNRLILENEDLKRWFKSILDEWVKEGYKI